MRLTTLYLTLALLLPSLTPIPGQSPETPKTLHITEWVGQRFVFLNRKPSLRSYGYQGISRKGKRIPLPYDAYVGRVVTVTRITPGGAVVPGAVGVEMKVVNTDERLVAEAVNYHVEGITPLADIEYARSAYKGKSLWLKEKVLERYDPANPEAGYVSIESSPAKVEVADVVVGESEEAPARFVLKVPSGELGFVDISVTGTNASESLRAYHLFDEKFFSGQQPAPNAPATLPEGRYKVTTEYDRFTDTTTAVLQETFSRPASGLEGLWVTAAARYQGTKSAGKVTFILLLSSTDKSGYTAPLQYSKAETLYLLTDKDRLSITVEDYNFRRSEVMRWVEERATAPLSKTDVDRLLNAGSVEGKWGNTEFRVRPEAIEGFKEFVQRLGYDPQK
jgi:hypothetical protein